MKLLNDLLNNSQSNFDPLNFIGILVTVIASIYIFKTESSISFTKERHNKLIFPLFNPLEPYLYSSLREDVLLKALDIIDNNKNIADGKLLELHYYCSCSPTQKNYILLCSYVDKAYDTSCRKLGLKTRSFFYRFNRAQYRNKEVMILLLILYALFSLCTAFCLLILVLSILLTIYNSADIKTQIIMLIAFFMVFLAIAKYVLRKS